MLGLRFLVLLVFFMSATSAAHACLAHGLELTGEFTQGGFAVGQTWPGAKVTLDGQTIKVSDDGYFLLGFGREAPATARLQVNLPDGQTQDKTLTIASRTYDIQRIDGLPSRQVSPNAEDLKRIAKDRARTKKARAKISDQTFFAQPFAIPIPLDKEGGIRISGVYGSQRILNGEPRNPHMGLDIAAPVGTPIKAPADATVVMAAPDMYYNGNAVMLDFGHGLSGVFIHMTDIKVTEGQQVKQGDIIGTVGATGRATGPHLHWGMTLNGTGLDPALFVEAGEKAVESKEE